MDFKKIKTEHNAESHNLEDFEKHTGNLYEAIAALALRADQIGISLKEELDKKVEEFQTTTDTLEEVFENREQIEIARYYESLPKPTRMAIWEYLNEKTQVRNPMKELDQE